MGIQRRVQLEWLKEDLLTQVREGKKIINKNIWATFSIKDHTPLAFFNGDFTQKNIPEKAQFLRRSEKKGDVPRRDFLNCFMKVIVFRKLHFLKSTTLQTFYDM